MTDLIDRGELKKELLRLGFFPVIVVSAYVGMASH